MMKGIGWMGTILSVVLLIVVLAVVGAAAKQLKEKAAGMTKGEAEPQFFGKKLLTDTEQACYWRIKDALPEYVVLAQVQVSQLVGIKKGPAFQTWFNKISRKSVDFVICMRDLSVVAAIELDDASHDSSERKRKDADKDKAIEGAGIPIIRWHAKDMPSTDEIRRAMM